MAIHTTVGCLSRDQREELHALRTGGDPAAWVTATEWKTLVMGIPPLVLLLLIGWGQFDVLSRWELARHSDYAAIYSLIFGYGAFFLLWAVRTLLRNARRGFVNASFGLVRLDGGNAVIFPHGEIQSVELSQVTTGSMLNDQTIGTSHLEIGGGIRVMHRHRQYSLALIIDGQPQREVIVFPSEDTAAAFQTRLVGFMGKPESVALPPSGGEPGWGMPVAAALFMLFVAGPLFTVQVFFPWQNRELERRLDREVFVAEASGEQALTGDFRVLQEYLRLNPDGRHHSAVASREAEISDDRIEVTRRHLLADSSYRYEYLTLLREALTRRRVERYVRELAALEEDDKRGDREISGWRALQTGLPAGVAPASSTP